MWIPRLRKFLITPVDRSGSQTLFWFSLSLTFSVVYSILTLKQAFSGEYVVQDDARQHVFWMQRFVDPALFPNDLIADYFQSVAPAGYSTLYKLMAMLGLEPGLFSRLIPLVLSVITTGYCFGIALELLPIPLCGFITSLIYNQSVWFRDDFASATPRAFILPLFLAFLYYLLRRSLLPCLTALFLQALFYPAYVLVSAGVLVLQLVHWQNGSFQLSRDRQDYQFCVAGLAVSVVALLPFSLTSSSYGPTIKAAEAKQMPEFLPGGRSRFFSPEPMSYWFTGTRSGMISRSLLTPVTVIVGFFLPVLMLASRWFPLAKLISRRISLLPKLLVASIVLFLLAHAVLFKLHLPSRYTGLGFRLVLVLAAGITFTLILDAVYGWAERQLLTFPQKKIASILALGTTLLISIPLIFYPTFVNRFPITGYRIGQVPSLYQFFAQQPKDSLIASLSEEANYLPSFAKRSILVGREYAIPYHVGYYRQFRQRTIDLIQAQYTTDPTVLQTFIQEYGVDFWLLDENAFQPEYVAQNQWIGQYQPAATEALETLQQGKTPILQQQVQLCQVNTLKNLIVLKASCISSAIQK